MCITPTGKTTLGICCVWKTGVSAFWFSPRSQISLQGCQVQAPKHHLLAHRRAQAEEAAESRWYQGSGGRMVHGWHCPAILRNSQYPVRQKWSHCPWVKSFTSKAVKTFTMPAVSPFQALPWTGQTHCRHLHERKKGERERKEGWIFLLNGFSKGMLFCETSFLHITRVFQHLFLLINRQIWKISLFRCFFSFVFVLCHSITSFAFFT